MNNRIPPLSEDVGQRVLDIIEEETGIDVIIVTILLPSDVENPQPSILTNVPPPVAEQIVKWIAEGLTPEIQATRQVIHGPEAKTQQ